MCNRQHILFFNSATFACYAMYGSHCSCYMAACVRDFIYIYTNNCLHVC